MTHKKAATAITTLMLLGGGALLAATPATAGGRPANVAFEHSTKRVVLHHDGSVTVREWVRCKPGWVSGDLSVTVNQGGAYADGYKSLDVPCDDAYRKVRLRFGPGYGTLHVGAATVSSQFLVTNADTGDSAAGHEVQRPVTIITR
jgi:hypothetical protein